MFLISAARWCVDKLTQIPPFEQYGHCAEENNWTLSLLAVLHARQRQWGQSLEEAVHTLLK